MKIRYATENDIKKAENIWRENFTDSESEIRFYFDELYKKENFLMLEDEEEQILASLHENPYTISINKKELPSFYIVGVAVSPEYRGRGYMNQLLAHSLKNAAQSKDIVFLSPINPEIYKKAGFGYISGLETYTLSMDTLPNNKIDKKVKIKKAGEYELSDLVYIYEAKMKRSFGYLKRDEKYYSRIKKEIENEGGSLYIFYLNDQPVAYVSMYFREGEIFVREFISLCVETSNTIFAFIKSFKEYYPSLVIKSFRGSNINFLLSNQLSIKKSETPFIMGRILNVKNILSLLNIKGYEIKIKIEDPFIESNNGIFLLNTDGSVEKIESDSWDLSMDISEFCSLAMGYFSGEELLLDLEKIQTENIDADTLNKIFPKRRFYIQEYQ